MNAIRDEAGTDNRERTRGPHPRPRPRGTPLDVALRFLAQRPRSEHELKQRLLTAGSSEADIEQVLAKLREHGVVDDDAFARYWVEQRRTFKPRGARLLRAELRQHGVGAELAASVSASTDEQSQAEAYVLASRRAQRLGRLDERTFQQRLGQFLQRRGFDWESIGPVVERVWREQRPE